MRIAFEPSRGVTIVVTTSAGGGNDVISRALATVIKELNLTTSNFTVKIASAAAVSSAINMWRYEPSEQIVDEAQNDQGKLPGEGDDDAYTDDRQEHGCRLAPSHLRRSLRPSAINLDRNGSNATASAMIATAKIVT